MELYKKKTLKNQCLEMTDCKILSLLSFTKLQLNVYGTYICNFRTFLLNQPYGTVRKTNFIKTSAPPD